MPVIYFTKRVFVLAAFCALLNSCQSGGENKIVNSVDSSDVLHSGGDDFRGGYAKDSAHAVEEGGVGNRGGAARDSTQSSTDGGEGTIVRGEE